ncbi:MAG TPA: polymer-forming cytoskeletal protein [bacterium]|jgi:cytoskeletal protein CcmA (bactofilin family)|nr:polymer-forming cytoskeletal protein [bacterium]HNT64751.1 polymer-forming cytoskeletal protein [bacterium]HOX85912.1 polymer-forming cytoskeletal protein [bacterium]HPG45105.1 polymer-forming cytoskeletal protein [bacterium]HPM97347.1 polymer-forming cytoskeletal protein [bacterium]
MFGKQEMKNTEKTGELNTLLGKGSIFEGNIKVEHGLRVDGQVVGDIVTSDTLVIGKDGSVKGNVKARNLVLGGTISGTAQVSGKIVLESKAVFRGEMNTARLIIDEGALFEGKCSMPAEDGKRADAAPAAVKGQSQ